MTSQDDTGKICLNTVSRAGLAVLWRSLYSSASKSDTVLLLTAHLESRCNQAPGEAARVQGTCVQHVSPQRWSLRPGASMRPGHLTKMLLVPPACACEQVVQSPCQQRCGSHRHGHRDGHARDAVCAPQQVRVVAPALEELLHRCHSGHGACVHHASEPWLLVGN